jgi:hypothetical protein
MFFHIDADEGHTIKGWLAPDNPSQIPKILVRIQDQEEFELEADVMRPDVRELGVHATGMVGFQVTNLIVPNLEQMQDVELLEASMRLPIFRRRQPERHVERKVFLFDCSVMPQRRIVSAAARSFGLNYTCSERYSLETMIVLLNNSFSHSLFFSGRSNFNRYSLYLRNAGYVVAAMLRDPFEELAERLLVLKLLSRPNTSHLLKTFVTGIDSLVDMARDLDFTDQKALVSAFRACSDVQRLALSSPMVKTFGCNVDEPPEWRHVAVALENLATMDVVGTESAFPLFRNLFNEAVGSEVLVDDERETFVTVQELAGTLSRVGLVADYLELDLALYSFAKESIVAAYEGSADELAARDTQTI